MISDVLFETKSNCRLCDLELPQQASLTLASTPPANEFVPQDSLGCKQDLFPLGLFECSHCGHVQLPYVVNPNRLFGNYVYVSGTSPVFVDHFKQYAEKMIRKFQLKPGDLVIDIGSNDGTLLKFFKAAGMRVLGVDPAEAIARRATADGIPTVASFFDSKFVESTLSDTMAAFGPAKLITANNVFAHADDLAGIVQNVRRLLTDDGAFVFEVSYLVDVVEKCLFDTIYHEHLSYHTVRPLGPFFHRLGMDFFDAERIDTHGGSLRGYVRKSGVEHKAIGHFGITILSGHEDSLGFRGKNSSPLKLLDQKIAKLKDILIPRLRQLKKDGKKIAAFGAPAKATTLMHHFELDKDTIEFVVDDSPLKQGLYTPGKHVPVVKSEHLYQAKPDYVVILAWNFADSIMKKHQAYIDQGGTFIVPIPEYVEFGKNR